MSGVTKAGLLRATVFFALVVAVPVLGTAHWILNMGIFVLMYAVMSSAWNLIGGMANYPSLGHAAFFGFGSYALAIYYKGDTLTNGWEPFLMLPLIAIAAAIISIPIGLIAMRTRADVFAIVTITLLFVAQTLAFNLRGTTGGSQGVAAPIPPFNAASFEEPFYAVLAVLLAITMGITWWVLRSRIGLALAAVRADEDKARGIGVHVTVAKVGAFAVSAGIVAMVGAIWAYYEGFVYPQFAFDPLVTVAIVLMTFLGGRGTLWGPVLGAVVLETAQQYLAYELGGDQIYLVAYAAIFLVVMLVLPRGVLPTLAERREQRRRRAAAPPTSPPAPSLPDHLAVAKGGTA